MPLVDCQRTPISAMPGLLDSEKTELVDHKMESTTISRSRAAAVL
jgi:hypothetical protein